MAVPSYTSDLSSQTISECESNSTPLTFTNIGTGADATETDYFIQNTACVSKPFNITAGGIFVTTSVAITTSGYCFWAWYYFGCPNALLNESSAGLQALIGQSATNHDKWDVLGKDTYTYGGWRCIPVDFINISYDDRAGSGKGSSPYLVFGVYCNTSAGISKGNPLGIDVMRYGRGEARINGGEAANYATFAGFAAVNDALTARWGLIQAIDGGYLQQGLVILGYSSAVDFRDSNKSILIANTKKVLSSFNRWEVRQSGSRVDWTNINITALGTVSAGEFECIDNADVNFDGCSFTNMSTFIFQAASSVINSIFNSCGLITSGGGVFTGTKVLTSSVAADAFAFGWNVSTNPDGYLDNMVFSKGTAAHHAIGFGTTCSTSMTLRAVTFSGFNAANGSNDSALYFADKGTNTTWTISLVGCTGTITYKKARSGDTVNFVIDPATFSVTVKDIDTGAVIVGARVLVLVSSGVNFPYQAPVTITSSSTTATVAHTAHGLASNDNVLISGASPDTYNGAFTITVTGVDSYQYTLPASATSPATGTIIATMALINKDTNGSGVASDSRTYPSANQPVTGWVRLATGSYYKQQPISETINKTAGLGVTVQLIPDV